MVKLKKNSRNTWEMYILNFSTADYYPFESSSIAYDIS